MHLTITYLNRIFAPSYSRATFDIHFSSVVHAYSFIFVVVVVVGIEGLVLLILLCKPFYKNYIYSTVILFCPINGNFYECLAIAIKCACIILFEFLVWL